MNFDRRTVLLGLGGVALTGCAAPGSAVYQVVDAYRALDRAKKEYPVTRADIEAQPLGVMGVQVEGGIKGIIIWNRRENGYDHWRSGNGVVIVTQAGRLIRTAGFPQDQLASRVVLGSEPLGTALDPARRYGLTRELDYLPDQYSVQAECELRYVRTKTIQLMGQAREVNEWVETVRLPRQRKKWKQSFDVDRTTGEVLRSVQHLGPRMRVILETLQPVAAQPR